MFLTRLRPALLVAACALLCGPGRPDDTAPAPRPVANDPEQIRKELEARLAGQPPERAIAVLEQLAQEWTARKGAIEVAYHRFGTHAEELSKAKQRLGDLKEPAPVPVVLRAADIANTTKAAQDAAEGHQQRVKQLETVKTALGAVSKAGDEFATAAGSADEHLFKMQTAAGLAKSVPADKLPAALTAKALTDAAVQLKTRAAEVKTTADKAKSEVEQREKELTAARTAAEAASAQLESLKGRQSELAASLAYEDRLKGLAAGPLADEFTKLRKELTPAATALKAAEADYAKSAGSVAEARAKFDAVSDPIPPATQPGGPIPALVAAQQHLTARLRTFDERAERSAALVAALDEQEKKAMAYSAALDDLRRAAGQLAAVAGEIERRVGRGDLDPAKVPEGVAEASAATGTRAKLDADATALQAALIQLRKDREQLRKPDTEAEGAKALVAALLANVAERLALHAELQRLAADYATARKDRPEAEQKRIEQRAADRMTKEAEKWDMALALDRSKLSTDIAGLLTAYYKELVELEEKDENLKRQKEALEKLVELTRKEAGDVGKLQSLLGKETAPSEPARWFFAWLAARLAPDGLKAEADAYHTEAARVGAVGGANARRVQALTSDIGKTRVELLEARFRGLVVLAVKIALVLLAAIILPRLAMLILRRAIRGGTDDAGNPAPVLRPLYGVLRLAAWATALAVVLSTLGYDVTALVAALAVVALALALAARPMIADALGSVAVSAERRFKLGDVVRVSGGEPARVVELTWRSTALKNANGVVSSVPNRTIAEATVENLTRGTEAYDTLTVTVSTDKDAGKVINVIRAAMAQCKNLSADQGVTVVSYVQKGAVKLVQYRFWWFLKDYEARNKTRDEVFARIAVGLAHEDMSGIEIALA